MDLALMKPYLFAWMSFVIRGCSLLARVFVINLTEELSKEISLKSLILRGLSTLGMRVMKDPLILLIQTSSE
jgi:hypothetical protein